MDNLSTSVVDVAWNRCTQNGMEAHRIRKCLFNTSKTLRKWNKEVFGIAEVQIQKLEKDLEQRHAVLGREDLKEITEQLRTQKARLESIHRQQSREIWLKLGIKITIFFTQVCYQGE